MFQDFYRYLKSGLLVSKWILASWHFLHKFGVQRMDCQSTRSAGEKQKLNTAKHYLFVYFFILFLQAKEVTIAATLGWKPFKIQPIPAIPKKSLVYRGSSKQEVQERFSGSPLISKNRSILEDSWKRYFRQLSASLQDVQDSGKHNFGSME